MAKLARHSNYSRVFSYTRLCSQSRLALWLIASLFLLGACSHAKYQQDFKSGTDFSQLKTYSWRSAEVQIPGANSAYMQGLIDDQMRLQGYQKLQAGGDMWLDLQGFTRISQGGNSSIGIGIGLPIGRHGSIGLGTGQVIGRGSQEAVLVLDITRAADNILVWRGNAGGLALSYFKLNSEPKLRDTIRQLLIQFPPR